MNSLSAKIPLGRVKFNVGDFVIITKEKVKFAKSFEQNYSTEIFQVAKDIQRMPNLFMNCQTYRLTLSKASFNITSLSNSFYPPKHSLK